MRPLERILPKPPTVTYSRYYCRLWPTVGGLVICTKQPTLACIRSCNIELMSKELNHLAAILHVYSGGWILWSKKKIVIIFQKENGNTFTLLIIFIVKSLQKEQNSTNLLLWPPICRNKPAITPKWFNSLDTNSTIKCVTLFITVNILQFYLVK